MPCDPGFDLWGQRIGWLLPRSNQSPDATGGQLDRRGRRPAGRTTAGRSLSGRGADRLRPALDGRQATGHTTSLDGLDQATTENDGAAALAQHCAVPQLTQRDPQRVEAGLSQWRQHRRRPGGSVVPTHPTGRCG